MVYPGHPLTFVYLALVKYGNAARPTETDPGSDYPVCLCDADLPGSGDGAWAGFYLLEEIRDGAPFSQVLKEGNDRWRRMVGPGSGNYEKAFSWGQEQADSIMEDLAALVTEIQEREIKPGFYCQSNGWFKEYDTIVVVSEVRDGHVSIRYQATRCSDGKEIWVQNSLPVEQIRSVREGDEQSERVLGLTGPYGE